MTYDLVSIKAKNNVQKEYNVLPQSSGWWWGVQAVCQQGELLGPNTKAPRMWCGTMWAPAMRPGTRWRTVISSSWRPRPLNESLADGTKLQSTARLHTCMQNQHTSS
jgi:hypothetical protein